MQSDERDTNTYSVSTIVEDMFQYFDDGLVAKKRKYRRLETGWKLRSALIVFQHQGLVCLEEAQKPLPMWVPTKDLLDALGTNQLSTAVEPLTVPGNIAAALEDARSYYAYAKDLSLSLEELPEYVARLRPALGVCELGWAEHMRGADGRLTWSITKSGLENIEDGTVARLALSDEPFGRN